MRIGHTSKSTREPVPARLEPLVRELAALPESERRAVIAAADEAGRPRRPIVSWASLKAASGIVHLGGDAVEDCERLYDG